MELMTIKQFADDQGVSYEAVRKQVSRYAEELSGHILKQNRTQYLDEKAVEFLKERRRESPIIMQTMDQGEEISRLKDQVESLRAQLMTAQNELLKSQDERLKAQDRIIELQDEAKKTLEDRARYTALLEDNEAKEKKLQEAEERITEARKTIEDLQKERDEAVTESKKYYKSWFGFYRKI